MRRTLTPAPDVDSLLALARRDPDAARAALDALPLRAQAALVCSVSHADRGDLIDLLERPERVIPHLPAAEVCFTARALGLGDAGALLQHATVAQLRTAVDLDAWACDVPDRGALSEWLFAAAEAGEEGFLELVRGLDRELMVLWLRDAAKVSIRDGPDFDAPDGAMTIEGLFFLVPRRDDDHLERVMQCLRVVFEADDGLYFQLLQGAIHESDADCEEFALRWRTGRLADLGFPAREDALRAFGYVRRAERADLDRALSAPAPERVETRASRDLPAVFDTRHALFRAALELRAAEREIVLRSFLALANRVAVATRLPLGEPGSIPKAVERAAATASRGLLHVAEARKLPPAEVLRRASLERLHRVGASLEADERSATATGAVESVQTRRGA